jgi:hypothetical protein
LEDETSGHYSGKLIPIQQQGPLRDSEAIGKTINLSHGGNKLSFIVIWASESTLLWLDCCLLLSRQYAH